MTDPPQEPAYITGGEKESYATSSPLKVMILCATGRLDCINAVLDPVWRQMNPDIPTAAQTVAWADAAAPQRIAQGRCDGGPHRWTSIDYPIEHAGAICGDWTLAVVEDPRIAHDQVRGVIWQLSNTTIGVQLTLTSDPTLLFTALATFLGITSIDPAPPGERHHDLND